MTKISHCNHWELYNIPAHKSRDVQRNVTNCGLKFTTDWVSVNSNDIRIAGFNNKLIF